MDEDVTQIETSDAEGIDSEMADDVETIAGKKKSDEDGIIAILIG